MSWFIFSKRGLKRTNVTASRRLKQIVFFEPSARFVSFQSSFADVEQLFFQIQILHSKILDLLTKFKDGRSSFSSGFLIFFADKPFEFGDLIQHAPCQLESRFGKLKSVVDARECIRVYHLNCPFNSKFLSDLINKAPRGTVNPWQQKTAIGFGDPKSLRRIKNHAPIAWFFYVQARRETFGSAGYVRKLRRLRFANLPSLGHHFGECCPGLFLSLRRPLMSANNPARPIEPELDIAASSEEIIALSVALEATFTQFSKAALPCAEVEVIPTLIAMIEAEAHTIAQAIVQIRHEGASA